MYDVGGGRAKASQRTCTLQEIGWLTILCALSELLSSLNINHLENG